MPLSNLNKIIAHFLVGVLVLLWVAILFWNSIYKFILSHEQIENASVAVILSLLLLAGSSVGGAIIEGVSDMTLRKLVKRTRTHRALAKVFGQGSVQESLLIWESAFCCCAKLDPSFTSILDAGRRTVAELASGIFYKNASKEEIEWVISHYATYYLATNYLVVYVLFGILGVRVVVANSGWAATLLFLGVLMSAFYFTWSLAVDRYLYSYFARFRFSALWLTQHTRNESLSKCSTLAVGGTSEEWS